MINDQVLLAHIERLTGRQGARWDRTPTVGYTQAVRRIVRFVDGGTVFAKAATDDLTATWLRAEIGFYRQIRAPFMPTLVAADDGDQPIMIIEDLQHGHWPPPWRSDDIERVRAMLDLVHDTPLPPTIAKLSDAASDLNGWFQVAKSPEPFLGLGLCSRGWLEESLPILVEAEQAADLAGEDLCHVDVRSDNICLLPDRVVLVDWNNVCQGNGAIDLISWLPSLALEGGPSPDEVEPAADPALVAMLAGYWAWRAPQPPPSPDSQVREIQLRQLEVALPWAARRLGLTAPK